MKLQKVKATPRLLYPGKQPVPNFQETGSGPRIGLDGYGKGKIPLLHQGLNLRTVLPADSRFTDYVSPTP